MDSKRPIMHWALALDINFNIELKVPVARNNILLYCLVVRKARLAAPRGRGGIAGGLAGAGARQGEAQLPAAARLQAEEAEQRAQELHL